MGLKKCASLKLMLNVDEDIYLAIHSYDMAIGAVYLFVLMSFGQRLFQLWLPSHSLCKEGDTAESNEKPLWQLMKEGPERLALGRNLLIALLMVAVSGGIMLLMPDSLQMVVFIFLITALGIWGSSINKIQRTKGTFDMGMYLILIFSVVVASKVEVATLSNINPTIFGYITFVVFVSLILHVLLSRLKRIDADTVIITSTALICSPPFVPVVAGSLKNRSLIVPGLTIGLIGYALGNYLGYVMSLLLSLF